MTSKQKTLLSHRSYKNSDSDKNHPSLAKRMANRLSKYKQVINAKESERSSMNKQKRSGNNPLFAYPSIPPLLTRDEKYSVNSKGMYTKFATRSVTSTGEISNPLETLGNSNDMTPRSFVQLPKNQQSEARRPEIP